ncbi:hypothetical protein [Streptomyces colonosanans]|uniref:Secreted protein n=1 Tax=Streptomyces colonosanans TaxID=1428652 RepID=A0A1S2NU35_9ACTN|nr:hypothetical protein [Streptomyces colonosanans]OIJ85053.1 hypothetical protein BIV24_29520 [Streptomyces colonosanans]
MKSLKAAAVVAGSLVVAGAAAPAFASNASDLAPTGVNGALQTLTSQRTLDVRPVQHQSDALDSENKSSVLSTVKSATTRLNQYGGTGRLLGGLPLQSR